MTVPANHRNDLKVAQAFTKQSISFDQLYREDAIVQYKRRRVRELILGYAKPNSCMLELNCGTGEDAIFFAQKGFCVHATDISEGMLHELEKKIECSWYRSRITKEQCSFTALKSLRKKQRFDYIYSNLGGLNCTSELEKVLDSFDELLKPGGIVTLVIISKFCLWETLLLFKGKFTTAFRRFFSEKGRKAHVEGTFFTCWYYSPSFIKKSIKGKFEFLGLDGLCTLVPPSYLANFDKKHPLLFQFCKRLENRLKGRWPWNRVGDYFIISFKKKS